MGLTTRRRSHTAPTAAPSTTRWLIKADIPDVMRIERGSFGDAAWDEYTMCKTLNDRGVIGRVIHPYGTSTVGGFLIYRCWPHRLHLERVAIRADWRRRGLAGELLGLMAAKLLDSEGNRYDYLTASVPDTNTAAHLFLRATGWRATGVLRASEKDSRPRDEYAFEWRLLTKEVA